MTEEQLNKIFQQVFETENGRVILEQNYDRPNRKHRS
jgi:hypothetical protein